MGVGWCPGRVWAKGCIWYPVFGTGDSGVFLWGKVRLYFSGKVAGLEERHFE